MEQSKKMIAIDADYFRTFAEDRRDVFTYHHGQENLGEIRTILMAVRLGIGIFMSNDKEAKRYVVNQINHRSIHINVYNVYDTLAAIGKKVDRQMQWKAVKGMSKAVLSQERYEDIRKIWVNGS